MSKPNKHQLKVLATLADTIAERSKARPEDSYTAKLVSQGVEKCAKKFGEEAVETALAAMTGEREHIASETADVLYHLLVLLNACDVPLSDVMTKLEQRTSVGGLAEKAARAKI